MVIIFRPSEILQCLLPCLRTDQPACRSADEVPCFEVDSAVPTRNSRLIGGICEGGPMQRYWWGWSDSRLNDRAAYRKADVPAKVVAMRPAPQNLGPCGTKRAVSGN